MDSPVLEQNRRSWDAMADTWFGATALPEYGCLAPTEEELKLFPPLRGKRVLDMGCGSGHSLKWCGEQGASELWGVDISARQIEAARTVLGGYNPRLFCAPMEAGCGLPEGYFDVAYSIYALGWSTDLPGTVRRIAACLKAGGVFLFSWDHPLMHCLEERDGALLLSGSYLEDESFSFRQRGFPVTLQNHRMSAWINAVADAGLRIQRLVEETAEPGRARPEAFSSEYYSTARARKLPMSFVLKAEKPG